MLADQPPVTTKTDNDDLPFAQALTRARDLAESTICDALVGAEGDVADSMIYAVKGGKGLRAFLVIESARLFGIDRFVSRPAAGAIEAIHAYSLIHDDLPCMDDDDLRRGKPTVHRKWNEHIAVLAGDALQALAFELLGGMGRAELTLGLANAAGVRGMVGGQAMDIAAEGVATPLSLDEIMQLQAGKTGALIRWAASAGAVMAGEDPAPLESFGGKIGIAFQIADDILDVEGDAASLGKAVGKDAGAGKATFVSHLGLDGAKSRARELVTEACDALSSYGDKADCLKDAARFVISR